MFNYIIGLEKTQGVISEFIKKKEGVLTEYERKVFYSAL